MPVCPSCGAATAPGPACGACGKPLPQDAPAPAPATTSPGWTTLKMVGVALLVVGIFIALSGAMLVAILSWDGDTAGPFFGLVVLVAGGLAITAAVALMLEKSWGWGLAVGLVAFGLLYALIGLARGYESGIIGLAVWGVLGWFLWQGGEAGSRSG